MLGFALAFVVLTVEFFFQLRFFKNRYQKLKKIHDRLSDFEFRRYTKAITTNNVIIKGKTDIGYALRPKSIAEYDYGPLGNKWAVKVNNIGIRHSEDISQSDYKKRSIVLLGDSVTFGAGVDIEETFAFKLREKIKFLNKDIEVLNFAVGGYSIIDNIGHFYYRNATKFNPVCVI